MPDHDVVIVGGGPVGMLLGCVLRQRGVEAVVYERRIDPDQRSRAIGIHPPGLAALDAAGVGEAVRREALALRGGDVVSRGRTLAAIDFPSDRPVLTLGQQRMDALLRARLQAQGADAVRSGSAVGALVDEGPRVRVLTDDGRGAGESTARFVVIADGVHSSLRSGLGPRWRRRPGHGEYSMIDIDDADAGDRATLFCEPDGLVESFPLPNGRRRWVVRRRAGDEVETAEGFAATVERRVGIRPDVPCGVRPSTFRATQHLADRFVRGRIALIGDAAHEVSPIGGQGMNIGWTNAVRFADALPTLSGLVPPDLGAWEDRARRSARRAQDRSRFYMAMGMPLPAVAARGREVVIRALGAQSLRRRSADLVTMNGL